MKVDLLSPAPLVQGNIKPPAASGQEKVSFAEQLQQALKDVNQLQLDADAVTRRYLAGEVQDLHQVTIATEQANLALQLTVQIRNKIIEAYQEISRMQI